jgi:hypothetical protein
MSACERVPAGTLRVHWQRYRQRADHVRAQPWQHRADNAYGARNRLGGHPKIVLVTVMAVLSMVTSQYDVPSREPSMHPCGRNFVLQSERLVRDQNADETFSRNGCNRENRMRRQSL